MASAKHPLTIHGGPVRRHVARRDGERDHGGLMPWLVLATALLALATSTDAGLTSRLAPASPAAALGRGSANPDLALLLDTGTRAALAETLSGRR